MSHIVKNLFFLTVLSFISGLALATDTDGDGIDDADDNCVSVYNPDQLDTDGDLIGNECDADDDGDNIIDSQDAFPLDPKYSKDTDGDLIPDRYEQKNGLDYLDSGDADLDIDNDGLTALEEFNLGTNHRLKDTDRDTLPDNWELQNNRNPLVPDYSLSSSCFTGDGVNLCWDQYTYNTFYPSIDGLNFQKLLFNNGSLCGISNQKVYCWSHYDNTSMDVPNITEQVIDIARSEEDGTVCALTNTKRVICWNLGTSTTLDQDGDGIDDLNDLCTQFSSTNQNDEDNDGLGDVCDADANGDGVIESADIRDMDDVTRISMGSVSDQHEENGGFPAFAFTDDTKIDQNREFACQLGGFDFYTDLSLPYRIISGGSKLECWRNTWNQYTDYGTSFLETLDEVSDYALSEYFQCAISDGEVLCAVSNQPRNSNSGGQRAITEIPTLMNPVRIEASYDRVCALHDGGLSCWGDSIPHFNFPNFITELSDDAEIHKVTVNTTCLINKDIRCWGSDWNEILSQGLPTVDFQKPKLFDSYWTNSTSAMHGCAVDMVGTETNSQDVICFSGNSTESSHRMINGRIYSSPTGSEIIDLEMGTNYGCVIIRTGSENEIKCFQESLLHEYLPPWLEQIGSISNPIDISQRCVLTSTELVCADNESIILQEQVFNATKLNSGNGEACIIEQRGLLCFDLVDGQGMTSPAALLNPRDIFHGTNTNQDPYACAVHDLGVKCWGTYNFEHESSDIRGNIGDVWRFHSTYKLGGICVNDGGELLCQGLQTGDPETLEPFRFYSFDPDGDGYNAWEDSFPLDGSEIADFEGDGIGDNADTDDDNDGIPDAEDSMPLDTDNDGLNNNVDDDDDSDGIPDDQDQSPLDTDNDTLTNDIDTDDDNDGYPDDEDAFPLDFYEHLDTDGDGIGNNADTDDDGDGLGDDYDAFPLDASEQVDTDSDGIGDNGDNCPEVSNEDQSNFDNDSSGDACDPDDDNDGANDDVDAFPLDPSEQTDTDSDGIGNNADTDDDNDGYSDDEDAFPLDKNEWVDTDSDGIGNNADTDDDGDNVPDISDAFPLDPTEWVDTDSDGIGNNADTDDDNDGYSDGEDEFPLDVNEWVDTDADGIGNNADTDDDNDGYSDDNDAFPLDKNEWLDTDSDGIGNNADTDDDNDGYSDDEDAFPLDPTEAIDTDSDGIGNNTDTDDDNDGYSDDEDAFPLDKNEWIDTDSDGIGNNADTDDDNDGVSDDIDVFPLDPNEWVDTDSDGIGNNADTDDDNDGVPDAQEIEDGTDPLDANSVDTDRDGVMDSDDAFPLDPNEWVDSDLDGIGNNADNDDDNDGVSDDDDAFPLDGSESVDTDSDGIGNNADTDDDGDGVEDSVDVYPLNPLYSKDSDSDGMPDVWEAQFGLDPNDPSDALGDADNDGISNLQEFLDGTPPSGSLDIDGNERYDALTDGLLILRSMFGLDGSSLTAGTAASDAVFSDSDELIARINTLGDLADIDGSGDIDALTDGLLILRHLFGLEGETLVAGVVSDNATRTTEEIEAHLNMLMP